MRGKISCKVCGNNVYSKNLPVCPECARKDDSIAKTLHRTTNKGYKKCCLCSNFCDMSENSTGLCGLRGYTKGKRFSLSSPNMAVLSYYEDPLPTNCCNAWFCRGSRLRGTNLAVFYYGCNFDCLFCQNWEHKNVRKGRKVKIEEMIEASMIERVKCICHFGGSPEPQLPFALRFSDKVTEKREIMICWEWNGGGRKKYVKKAAELSSDTGGTVKFDLKAWNEKLHRILTGRSNRTTLSNFATVFETAPEVLSATTLLVPYYVDKKEVEAIAQFIASFSHEIPYSLLIFHPDYMLMDLPITPVEQVRECYRAARKHLKNVNVGNLHLIGHSL